MEETKGRNSGSGPSESGRRSDRRHETESRSWAENRGHIRENLQQQEQRLRDAEMQRRSHETEPRFLQHKNSVEDCWHYLRNGVCHYGSGCRFNHPPERIGPPHCKFFQKGTCKNGSVCRFRHSMDRDGAEPASFGVHGLPTHQATSSDRRASESNWRFDERRHETGSSSRPEKRARTIPDSRERDPRGSFEDINQRRDGTVAGLKRARLEQGHGNIEWQRREGEENVQEQRQQIENVEWHKEFMEKQRLRNLEEERLREIDRQRRESRMRLDQMQQTVKFDEPHGVEESLRELGTKRREDDGF